MIQHTHIVLQSEGTFNGLFLLADTLVNTLILNSPIVSIENAKADKAAPLLIYSSGNSKSKREK